MRRLRAPSRLTPRKPFDDEIRASPIPRSPDGSLENPSGTGERAAAADSGPGLEVRYASRVSAAPCACCGRGRRPLPCFGVFGQRAENVRDAALTAENAADKLTRASRQQIGDIRPPTSAVGTHRGQRWRSEVDARRRRPPRAARSELAAMAPPPSRRGRPLEPERVRGRARRRGPATRPRADNAWTTRGCGTRAATCAARATGEAPCVSPPTSTSPGDGAEAGQRHSERSTRRGRVSDPETSDDHDFPVGGDRLAGTFVEGVLHGPAVYHSAGRL